MKHYQVLTSSKNDHFGISTNTHLKKLLIQVQEDSNQSRIALSEEEAIFFMKILAEQISKLQESNAESKPKELTKNSS